MTKSKTIRVERTVLERLSQEHQELQNYINVLSRITCYLRNPEAPSDFTGASTNRENFERIAALLVTAAASTDRKVA
jgi:hypothetical protein